MPSCPDHYGHTTSDSEFYYIDRQRLTQEASIIDVYFEISPLVPVSDRRNGRDNLPAPMSIIFSRQPFFTDTRIQSKKLKCGMMLKSAKLCFMIAKMYSDVGPLLHLPLL